MRTRIKGTLRSVKNHFFSASRERRKFKAIICRRDQHIARLKAEVTRLRSITEPVKVANHTYPAQMIAMAVFIVIHAKGSLRCAAKVVGYYSQLMNWEFDPPSHGTIDNWVRRLGLYALDHMGSKTGEYIGIIDESIQIGREKCLLLLGVRLPDESSHFAPLTMADVEVLGVEVQNSWKTEEVAEFVDHRLVHHRDITLRYMVSDQGSNLRAAAQQLNLDTVIDCSHFLMNGLKKLLTHHELLQQVTAFMGRYRSQNILSERTHLCPPTLRDKDRFLKIFIVLDWMIRINGYWPNLCSAHQQTLSFMYQPEVTAMLEELTQVRKIISMATGILKTSGINYQSRKSWIGQLTTYRAETTLCPMAEQLVKVVEDYFDRHDYLLVRNERLICCTDIIESIFGRYKNKGGMKVISSDVLSIPLYAHTINLDFVQQGLATVNQQMVKVWHDKFTCDNRYRILRHLKPTPETVTAVA